MRELIAELDPRQAILLDYTSDTTYHNNFTAWGLKGKFPWIFGIFSGYEWESEIRGFYELTTERIKIAKEDPFCRGVVLWPELSHGDPLVSEYLALNAWEKDTLSVSDFVKRYCADRYTKEAAPEMTEVWLEAMPIVTMAAWSMYDNLKGCGMPFAYPARRITFDPTRIEEYRLKLSDRPKYKALAAALLKRLSKITPSDGQHRRDLYDLARTILERFLGAAIWKLQILYLEGRDEEGLLSLMDSIEALLRAMTDLLASHEDFSLYDSLEKLRQVTETNPNFEVTLKNNASCRYCRSFIYENAEYLYLPELEAVFAEVKEAIRTGREIDREAISKKEEAIRRAYMALPLAEMEKKKKLRPFAEVAKRASEILEKAALS